MIWALTDRTGLGPTRSGPGGTEAGFAPAIDLSDQYGAAARRPFYGRDLVPLTGPRERGQLEPMPAGFALLCAPAYAVGGRIAVELWLAALAARGFVVAAALARRLVPAPWATRGVLAAALSPPAVIAATTIAPEAVGASALAGAAALALAPAWLLTRSRRTHRTRTLGEHIDVEVTAAFLLLIAAATIVTAAFLALTLVGPCFVAHELIPILPILAALTAWPSRHFPRTALALTAPTLALTAYTLLAARLSDTTSLAPPHGALPWT